MYERKESLPNHQVFSYFLLVLLMISCSKEDHLNGYIPEKKLMGTEILSFKLGDKKGRIFSSILNNDSTIHVKVDHENYYPSKSWDQLIDDMKDGLNNQLKYMDSQIVMF